MNSFAPEIPEASSAGQDSQGPAVHDAPASSGPSPQPSSTFHEAFEGLTSNLADASAQILGNRFQKSGIGYAGTLFRCLEVASQTQAEAEMWSSLLELASKLWSEGEHEASVKLLQDAQLRLSPPDIYQDSISGSIVFGQDYMLYIRAKRRFDEGDDTGAAGLISQMSEGNRKSMEKELQRSSGDRSRSRRTAFIAAGIAGSFCAIASVASMFMLRDLVREPHTMRLPDFDLIHLSPPTAPQSQGSNETVAVEAQISIGSSFPGRGPGAEQQSTPPAPSSSNVFGLDTGSTNMLTDYEMSDRPQEVDADELPAPAPEVAPIDAAQLAQCGLAFRISTEAVSLAQLDGDARKMSQAAAFSDAFFSACQSLPASLIQEAGAKHSIVDVSNYATAILNAR